MAEIILKPTPSANGELCWTMPPYEDLKERINGKFGELHSVTFTLAIAFALDIEEKPLTPSQILACWMRLEEMMYGEPSVPPLPEGFRAFAIKTILGFNPPLADNVLSVNQKQK